MKPTRLKVTAIAVLGMCASHGALADTTWHWQYTGTSVDARGTFTSSETADASGFHQITSITGTRNGDLITGLYPTGLAIPGNEPYALDNLIRVSTQGQITVHGFGFSTASGGYANPYFADFLSPPSYTEVFTGASGFSEVPISFGAAVVPEPGGVSLALTGLGLLGIAGLWRCRQPGIAYRRRRASAPSTARPAKTMA